MFAVYHIGPKPQDSVLEKYAQKYKILFECKLNMCLVDS